MILKFSKYEKLLLLNPNQKLKYTIIISNITYNGLEKFDYQLKQLMNQKLKSATRILLISLSEGYDEYGRFNYIQ